MVKFSKVDFGYFVFLLLIVMCGLIVLVINVDIVVIFEVDLNLNEVIYVL